MNETLEVEAAYFKASGIETECYMILSIGRQAERLGMTPIKRLVNKACVLC